MAQKRIEVVYKGAEIFFNERDEVWCAKLDDAELTPNASLAKLKEAIDRAVKKSNKPIPCLKFKISKYSLDYRRVTVTSIDANGDVWYTDNEHKDERRGKEDMSRDYDKIWFVISNDVNEKTLLEIHANTERIKKLEKEIRDTKDDSIRKGLTLVPYLKNANEEVINMNE